MLPATGSAHKGRDHGACAITVMKVYLAAIGFQQPEEYPLQ